MFEILALLLTALFNIGFVYIILSGQRQKLQNKLFATAITFNILWVIGVITLITSELSYVIEVSRIFFIAPMFTAYFLILFSAVYPSNDKPRTWKIHTYLLIPLLAVAIPILVNPNVIIESVNNLDSLNEFTFNSDFLLIYGLFFSSYFSYSYFMLFMKSKTYSGSLRRQLRFMFWSALLSSGPALLTNIFLPLLGNSRLLWLGPIFTLTYLAIVTYSIARYRMLDVRIIAAKTVAYLLSLLVLSGLFFVIIFFFFSSITDTTELSRLSAILLFMFAATVGMLTAPLKRFFDRLTGKIFYREGYNLQEKIGRLSTLVVNEFEIDELSNKSLLLIRETINPTAITLILLKNDEFYGSFGDSFFEDKYESIESVLLSQQEVVLEPVQIEAEMQGFSTNELNELNNSDVIMSVLLSVKQEKVGFILVGPKLSGGDYSSQDQAFMTFAANELSIAVQNSLRYDEIKRFNETLRLEVDRATEELRESNRKLKELDEAKDEFVTMASHQLRTPLTSVKGYLSMVMEGDAGSVTDRQKELLQNAFTSSQRMVYLIADLLNVSRLKTGKFVIDTSRINLKEIVEAEITQLKESAKARGISLKFDAPKRFPDVMLDENKTRQVIMNFIDNAIYYTKSGGKIVVKLSKTKESIELKVTDTGIGVPKHERPKLFTKFYRANNARKARPDGTGLGLFMAKKVVVAQGGAVIFDSKEGEGSTFGFSFPLKRVGVSTKKSSAKATKPKKQSRKANRK